MALLSAICFEKWKLVGKRAAREDYYGLAAFWGENKGLTVAGKGIWVCAITHDYWATKPEKTVSYERGNLLSLFRSKF